MIRTAITALCLASAIVVAVPKADAATCATQLAVRLRGVRQLRPVIGVLLNGKAASAIFDTGGAASYITPDSVLRLGLSDTHAEVSLRSFGQLVTAERVHTKSLQIGQRPAGPADFLAVGNDPRFDGTLGWPAYHNDDVLVDLPSKRITLFPGERCAAKSTLDWVSRPDVSILKLEAGDTRPIARVRVNGIELRALFDTGTPDTSLTEEAARRTGVLPDTTGVTQAGFSGGLGAGGLATWQGTFRSVEIGRETTRNVRLFFIDKPNASADMILGADYFRKHRVFISRRRGLLYILSSEGGGFWKPSL